MKKDKKIVIICLVIYVINRLLKSHITIPVIGYFCRCYLNDFICGIGFCAYFNYILQKGNGKALEKYYQIFIMIFCIGMLWEYFFPIIIPYSISDKYDVLAYVLGGSIYYLLNKLEKKKLNKMNNNKFEHL